MGISKLGRKYFGTTLRLRKMMDANIEVWYFIYI